MAHTLHGAILVDAPVGVSCITFSPREYGRAGSSAVASSAPTGCQFFIDNLVDALGGNLTRKPGVDTCTQHGRQIPPRLIVICVARGQTFECVLLDGFALQGGQRLQVLVLWSVMRWSGGSCENSVVTTNTHYHIHEFPDPFAVSGKYRRGGRLFDYHPGINSAITPSSAACQSGRSTPNASRSFVASSTEYAGRFALVG